MAGVLTLLGCGSGGSAAVPGGGPEAGEDATIEDAEAGPPVDAGDEGVPETGGPDAHPEAGPISNPGQVTCTSSLTCDIDAGVCCIPTAEDGGTPSCRPPSVPCEGPHYFCDEKADCLGGWVCCWVFNGFPTSICVRGPCSADPSQGAQRCKTDAECENGGPCFTQSCADGGTIQACSKLPGCN